MKKQFPNFLIFLIIFIAITNGLANMFSWYWRIPWFDMPMHFLGGLWVGLVALWLYFYSGILSFTQKVSPFKIYKIFAVSLIAVIIVGGIWELFEFGVNTVIVFSTQNSPLDTVSDIIFDILGGATAAGSYFAIYLKNKNTQQ
jgi:hypothetical protein